ncbi:hypothetical protein SVIOM74S_06271 [Streptomyces violarus]
MPDLDHDGGRVQRVPDDVPDGGEHALAGAQGGVEVAADLGLRGGGHVADDDVDAGQVRQLVRLGQEAVLEGEGDMPLHPVQQQRLGGERAGLGEAGEQPVGRGVGDRGAPYGRGEADRRPAVLGGRHGQAGVLLDARPEHPGRPQRRGDDGAGDARAALREPGDQPGRRLVRAAVRRCGAAPGRAPVRLAVRADHEHHGGRVGEVCGAFGGRGGEFPRAAGGLHGDDGLGQQRQTVDGGLGARAAAGPAHGGPYDGLDLLRLGGHGQIGVAARVQSPAPVAGRGRGGGEVHDGQRGHGGPGPYPAAQFEAAHVRQAHVDEGHVGQGAVAQPDVEFDERLAAAGDRHDLVAGPAQHRAHGVPAGRDVVHDQHGGA